MFRFVVLGIFIFIQLISNGTRSEERRDILSQFISSKMRRKRALKVCKNFIKVERNRYKLQNSFVTVTIDKKGEVLECRNRKNNKESIIVEWGLQSDYSPYDNTGPNNRLNERFDAICMEFDSYTTYFKIENELIISFQNIHIRRTKDPAKAQKYEIDIGPKEPTVEIPDDSVLLNINEADEKQITDLPGISAILAKKIIKYRESNDGFKSKDEFYEKMKIKAHFRKKLDVLICVKEYDKGDIEINFNERILDI